jgi:NADH:ubiquinone oxidoreductase subunit E
MHRILQHDRSVVCMDPISIGLVIILIGTFTITNVKATHDEETDLDATYCLGACAIIKGSHKKGDTIDDSKLGEIVE